MDTVLRNVTGAQMHLLVADWTGQETCDTARNTSHSHNRIAN
jgi:hypothetical protein